MVCAKTVPKTPTGHFCSFGPQQGANQHRLAASLTESGAGPAKMDVCFIFLPRQKPLILRSFKSSWT
ncbi:MAG: hypothetical protein EAZ62_05335 [Sphingobacteriia bacterium]|nr:MAG: hypothetical protein EAZ62_05335 [Sphingobacteriia bacterium]